MKAKIFVVLAFSFLVVGIYACGGGGGSSGTQGALTPSASALVTLKTNMTKSLPMIAPAESGIIFVMNPGTLLAQGITTAPDLAVGSPPNTFTFSGPYDGNGDGIKESNVTGRTTLNTDPAAGWSGLTGTATIDVNIPVVGHLYTSSIAYAVTSADERLSGSGTFSNPLTGAVTSMSVPAGTPLVIKPATGAANAVANACGYSLDGQVKVSVTDTAGRLDTDWVFSSASPTASVRNATYTDGTGQVTALPDSTTTLTCGSGGSVTDWVAAYHQDYTCLPRESGSATLTLAAAGSDTVTITDEDPPGSGTTKTYTATMVGGSPHALRGFFIAGPVGNRYREDFTWTRSKNGNGFSQFSVYTYIEGPNLGKSGICGATAVKL